MINAKISLSLYESTILTAIFILFSKMILLGMKNLVKLGTKIEA